METSPPSSGLLCYQAIVPDEFIEQLLPQERVRRRKRVYWAAVVIWLMIYQRLHNDASLQSAVLALPARWRPGAKRVSAATGGYCQARQRVPTLVVEKVADHVFETLRAQAPQTGERPVFLVDGTVLRLECEEDLAEAFPPGRNRLGENRWPLLLLVAFHDAHTGLAARPSWGPMHGERAVSEQSLALEALERLPANALVLADANFGIFSFAWAVVRSQRPALLRLTPSRARKILGQLPKKATCRSVRWTPSSHDRSKPKDLPEDAHIDGWVLTCAHPHKKGEKLYLFSTLEQTPQQALATYGLRWNIETDLRNLKRTVELHQIRGRSLGVVEKELLLAVTAYNLVRAVMFQAARASRRSPRQMSFAHTQAAVLAALPALEQAPSQRARQRLLRELVNLAAQLALPKRKRKRPSYPRQVWGRGATFPRRLVHPPKEQAQ
jgi:hypothetical protein